ncbi:MAG TPA: ABC transporter ATP-binding protein [Xanthobacteraceae bacterium]|jgi:NitT/TauT family transport system ATP-binding protein|nr:ABC transporter ATP-binding protein [Xanthobacteraceae bacterium]
MAAAGSPRFTFVPEAAAGNPIIEVKNLKKVFAVGEQHLTVFSDLSFRIERGSFLSIVGPSGCGKSTLLKLISGLDTPTAGEIVFNGTTITGPAKGMIYVFQQYTKSIFPWRTVIQNIEWGLRTHKRLGRKEARDRCLEYIRLVGLQGYENYHPYQLSGGMQQRVVIARALICEPDVLLMDEPFSAVDAMTRAILQELIMRIWQTIPVTILFVTHDVEEAAFLSNRIISLGRAPATIKEDVTVDLPYPRDPITTRDSERFVAIRQRLFSSIFIQEKGVSPGSVPGEG